MHGGAHGSGAPKGERNGAYVTGLHTNDSIAERRKIMAWLVLARLTVKSLD